jgi:hypothetical protein
MGAALNATVTLNQFRTFALLVSAAAPEVGRGDPGDDQDETGKPEQIGVRLFLELGQIETENGLVGGEQDEGQREQKQEALFGANVESEEKGGRHEISRDQDSV